MTAYLLVKSLQTLSIMMYVEIFIFYSFIQWTDLSKADADAILFHNFKTKIESKLNSPTEGKCDKRQKQSEQENAVQHGSDSGIGVWLKAIRYIFKKGDSDQGKVDKMADGAESNDKGVSTDQTKAYQSISDATALLVEVKDARDELNILKQLLAQQETVWNKLLNTSDQEKGLAQDKKSASRGDEKPASQRETDGLKGPGLAINDVEEMDKAAGRIQDSVSNVYCKVNSACSPNPGEFSSEPGTK